MKKKQSPEKKNNIKSTRNHKSTLCFNESEHKVIENYCKKYGIKNKSKFFREAIIALILQRSEENYPTLF